MVEEPLQVILEAAPLWERLLTILAPLAGGALAVIAGILLERRRSRRIHRREHLRDIQEKVFRPLGQKVKMYFLPTLWRLQSNIRLEQQQRLLTDVAATDYLWERRERLGMVPADLSSLDPLSDALYHCSKTIHYQEVIERYEALETDFNEYQSRCLAYVQSLADRIKQNMNLPDELPAPWIRAEALALHIYQRQQGLQPHGVRLRDSPANPTNTLELPDATGAIIQVTQAEAHRALELVTQLENNREKLGELISSANDLAKRAIELGENLERLRHTSSLNGQCDLIRE